MTKLDKELYFLNLLFQKFKTFVAEALSCAVGGRVGGGCKRYSESMHNRTIHTWSRLRGMMRDWSVKWRHLALKGGQ